MLSQEDKKELLEMSKSSNLREDLRRISFNRHNPFLVNGWFDMDRWLTFLTEYNEFLGHIKRPFCKIIDKYMLL